MLTPADLIHLACTPDLTTGGIAYAVRGLSHADDHGGGSAYDGLRRTVAAVAVELAFRRYLAEHGISFSVSRPAPFTQPDRYDVGLGGHRCQIRTCLISHAEQVAALQADASLLLEASALMPSDLHAADNQLIGDLYLFAFVLGTVGPAPANRKDETGLGQKPHLLYAMPASWRRPTAWRSLGQLAMKSDGHDQLSIEICGLNEARDFMSRSAELAPRKRVVVDGPFFSLSCIHALTPPRGRLGLHSQRREATFVIASTEWQDIGVFATDIFLSGYISREEFGRRARPVLAGSPALQFQADRTKNLSVPIAELRPLQELLALAA
jgi:hypothetical protein